jgi:hypothetical protein
MKNGPLQEMVVDSNQQKADMSNKSAGNSSFTGGIKRSTQNSCNRQPGVNLKVQISENTSGKPNETVLMKTRPATSF